MYNLYLYTGFAVQLARNEKCLSCLYEKHDVRNDKMFENVRKFDIKNALAFNVPFQ